MPVSPNLLDRVVGYVSPAAGLRRLRNRALLGVAGRSYDLARPGRAAYGWRVGSTSANAAIGGALPILRNYSRDLTRNNPHAAKAISSLVINSVGGGIWPRSKTGDAALDQTVDGLFAEFARQITDDGLSFAGAQALAARAMFEGGEVLVRRRFRRMEDGLRVPVQFQLLEGDFLDHNRNDDPATGGITRMGIQFDAIGRRTGYWLFQRHPGDRIGSRTDSAASRFVPAEQVSHLFEMQRPGQVRGVPWLAPVMIKLRELDDYEEAEIVRKRIEACIAAIVFGDLDAEQEAIAPLVHDAAGNAVEEFQPGMITYARGGKDIKFTQPAPGGGYGEYKRSQLHSIAAGARMTYELLTGDLSQVNFASYKAGVEEFRRMMTTLQWTSIIPGYCRFIWRGFIDAAVLAGQLPVGPTYDAEWAAPKFEPIDRQKDAMADLTEVRSGMVPLEEVIARRGYDPAKVLAQIAATNKLLDELGLVLDSDPRKTSRAGLTQARPPGSESPGEGTPDDDQPADDD